MKRILSILVFVCTLGVAELPTKPVVHMTQSPAQVTYYSSSFSDPAKFEFQYLDWPKFISKHKYGYTMVDGQWVREKLAGQDSSAPVRVFIPPSDKRGGLIITRTISQPPTKK